MKTAFTISLLFIYSLVNSQSNWVSVGPPVGDNFYSITTTPDSTYFAATFAPGKVYRSVDKGNTWIPIYTNSNYIFKAICFISNQVGFIAGRSNTSSVLRTIDGGATWSNMTVPNINTLNDIYFSNSNEGYAVGQYGTLLKSSNFGSNWSQIPFPTNQHLWDMAHVGPDSIFLASASGIYRLNSNPPLVNISSTSADGVDKGINDVFAIDDNNIIRFQNGQGIGTRLASNPLSNMAIKSILAVSDSLIFIAGQDRKIYSSQDGGQTFILETTPVNQYFITDLKYLNGIVWAVGVSGTILRRQLTVGEKEHIKRANEARIYPNPAKDFIWIKSQKIIDEVRIMNINGQVILTSNHPKEKFDISPLKTGIYFIQVVSSGLVSTKKIIKH